MSSRDKDGEAPLPFLVLNGDHMLLSTVLGAPKSKDVLGLIYETPHAVFHGIFLRKLTKVARRLGEQRQ